MNATDLFEILVRENAAMLIAYLRAAMGDGPALEDVFQETLLTAWRRIDDYDRSRPFGPWLRGIAARIMMAQHRASLRLGQVCDEETLEALSSRFQALQTQPGDTYEEKLETLQDCLSRLPEHYRDPIVRHYRDDLPVAGLSEQLNLSMETIKKRLQRGRQRLLECLQRKLSLEGST